MGVAVVSRPPAHAEESPVFLAVAHHYPRPEHLGAVVVVMCDVETGMAGTPGLISIESFRKVVETRLPAISRWESPEAAQAGVPRLMSIGERDPRWSARPDEVFQLEVVAR
jgi:hypothetical protein